MTSTTPLGKQKGSWLISSFDVAVLAVDFALYIFVPYPLQYI